MTSAYTKGDFAISMAFKISFKLTFKLGLSPESTILPFSFAI